MRSIVASRSTRPCAISRLDPGEVSTAHREALPGHRTRLVGEPADERRHEPRVQPVVQLRARRERAEAGLGAGLGVRRDDVGRDPGLPSLRGHRQGEADHAHLRHAVDRAAGYTSERRPGRHVDEAPATVRPHHPPRRPPDVERATQLRVDDRVELGLGELGERCHAHLTRVVDHDIDRAEGVERGLHDRGAALGGGDGPVVGDRSAAGRDDLSDHLVGRRRGRGVGHAVGVADAHPEVVDQDARTPRREEQRVLPAQVAPGPSDDHDLVVETKLFTHRCRRACALPSTRRSSRRSCRSSCGRRAARDLRGSCARAGWKRRSSPRGAPWSARRRSG